MKGPAYRSLFPELKGFEPDDDDLDRLAQIMSGRGGFLTPILNLFEEYLPSFMKGLFTGAFDKPEVPPKPSAGYTYLGQFIIHDLSDDGRNNRHEKGDLPFGSPLPQSEIDTLPNHRTPSFDLETLYGPIDKKTGIAEFKFLDEEADLPFLRLGWTEANSDYNVTFPYDLPRTDGTLDPEIVDVRNDENLFLAQLQVAFVKFHNALVVRLHADYGENDYEILKNEARRLAIRCYQKIILDDYLPRIADKEVVDEIRNIVETERRDELIFKIEEDDRYIPLEFAHAAFRFGHSQIRQNYHPNQFFGTQKLVLDFWLLTGAGRMKPKDNFVPKSLPTQWLLDWNLFFPLNNPGTSPPPKFNDAEPIDTELAFELLRLPAKKGATPKSVSLAALDLYRGRYMRLPSGQEIASLIAKDSELSEKQICKLIAEKEVKVPPPEGVKAMKTKLQAAFGKRTPLWFYILAEAEYSNTGKLGIVGSRIVAETIIHLMYFSEHSILQNDKWPQADSFMLRNGQFGMSDMLQFIAATNNKYQNLLYPAFKKKNCFTADRVFDEINPLEKEWRPADWPPIIC